ncbi:MAG: hypothetical protein J6X24_02890 [Firmicutes bacterium]|nr:hypothetical protein [Bacillota bacterium]
MLKPIAAMTDHEMLVELMQEKRRNDRARNIKYMIAGAIVLLIIILLIRYLPPAVRYFRSLTDSLNTIRSGVDSVRGVADNVNDKVNSHWDNLASFFRWGTSVDQL